MIVLDFYKRKDQFAVYSEKVDKKIFKTQEEAFKFLYHENNRLRYTNGIYWKLEDKSLQPTYNEFLKMYDTMESYYGNGIVD